MLLKAAIAIEKMTTVANDQLQRGDSLLRDSSWGKRWQALLSRASKLSIERIAKEGRKYGVTLLLSSQRPSEISETIFSQCSNFLAMRLTNPNDQNYVARLLPDTLGNLCDKLPTLVAGEALLIGESVVMPSIVKVSPCDPEPSSSDIPYFELWKEEWKNLDFEGIKDTWIK